MTYEYQDLITTFTYQAWRNVHTFISIKVKHFSIKVQALMSLHWNGFLRGHRQILIFIAYNLKSEVNTKFLVFKITEEVGYCIRGTTAKKLEITVNTTNTECVSVISSFLRQLWWCNFAQSTSNPSQLHYSWKITYRKFIKKKNSTVLTKQTIS